MAKQVATDAKDTHGVQDDAALARRYFIRDDDSRTRRLFAQEFVTQLKRIGSGTAEQLYDDGMSFFCCDPQDQGAIDYVGRMAQRYGWARWRSTARASPAGTRARLVPDAHAVSPGHSLIEPVRHVAPFLNTTPEARAAVGLHRGRSRLLR